MKTRIPHALVAAAAAVLLVIVAVPLQAQSLGISAGYGSLSGDDFDGIESGFTIGGELLFEVSQDVLLGGAFDYSSYGIEDTEEDLSQYDLQGVLRYLFPGDETRFFVGGRLGYTRQSIEILTESAAANGFSIGPSVGVTIPTGGVNVDVSVDGLYETLGDFSSDGDSIDGSDSSGFRFLGRAGISIPLGD